MAQEILNPLKALAEQKNACTGFIYVIPGPESPLCIMSTPLGLNTKDRSHRSPRHKDFKAFLEKAGIEEKGAKGGVCGIFEGDDPALFACSIGEGVFPEASVDDLAEAAQRGILLYQF